MPDVPEIPKPKPEEPVERTQEVRINLMGKRYVIDITTKTRELKDEPAKVLPFKRPAPVEPKEP